MDNLVLNWKEAKKVVYLNLIAYSSPASQRNQETKEKREVKSVMML